MTHSFFNSIRYSLLIAIFCMVGTLGAVLPTVAQDVDTQPTEQQSSLPPVPLQAKAGKDRNVLVGRTVLFDAAASTGPQDVPIQYHWDFGDAQSADGIDATHVYSNRGTYRVTLTISTGEGDKKQTSEDSIIVSVQDKLVVLITDQSIPESEINRIQEYANTQGTLVVPIRDSGVNQEYLTVQNIAQQIVDHQEDIVAANFIVTWTSGNTGLNSLVELTRIVSLGNSKIEDFGFHSKAIIAVNNEFISTAKIAQTTYESLKPQYIVVSNSNILDDVVQAQNPEDFQEKLSQVDANYHIITEYSERGLQKLGPFNFLSYILYYMINKGVPINSLYLVLMLPVMATIIAAARQLVGIKSFGIFAPTVIALSFLVTGLKYGITIFIAILLLGSIARFFGRRLRILYLPRMALVLSALALSIFAMMFAGAYFNKQGFLSVSIFPILIMTVVTEHFISVQVQQGYKAAMKLTIETLALAIIGYLLGDWQVFKTTILAYPELILLTFVFNYVLGKFSGLRLTEYIRFRNVFKYSRDA